MNYLNRGFATALALCSLGACTEVDDRLGESLLPENQQMKVEIATFTDKIDTYLYREDSLPASRVGHGYMGRIMDGNGVFGARTNGFLAQFLPLTLPYEDKEGFGFNPIIDSALILLSIDNTRGDASVVQTFDVYEVVEGPDGLLSRDSTYRANFPFEKYRGEKLFDFTHSGDDAEVSVKLFPTAAGRKYLDSIVHLDWNDYTTDSLFYTKFQGLYITPAPGSPADAAVFATDFEASGFELYLRNHDLIDTSAIYDTLRVVFSFKDSDTYDEDTGALTTVWDNVSINEAKFDYTGSKLGVLQDLTNNFTDTLAASPTQPLVYVQSMGGVGTMLRFDDELVKEIRKLGGGEDMMINQAMVHIWIEDDSTKVLDASIERIGSYQRLANLRPIPDYQYASEAAAGSGAHLPYSGYLNRSNGYYEFDITSFVQQLAKNEGKSYAAPVIYLAPEAYGLYDFGESVLEGTGSEKPVEMRITYTIIKR